MIVSSYWKRVGMVALAYMTTVSCTPGRWILRIDGADPEDDGLRQLRDRPVVNNVLEIHNYQLDKLPHDLGKNAAFKGMYRVDMMSVSAPDDFPTEAEENAITPFTSVTHLNLSTSSFGSPKSLSWIKLLFPNALDLNIPFKALPVRTESDIAACSARKLTMESVERITLYGGSEDQANLPIFENLRFFPNLELVQFEGFRTFLALENAQGDNISLEKVEKVVFDSVHPMSQDVMRKLPTVFPNVRDLHIKASAFEELTSGDSTGASIKSFEKLEELCIFGCDSDVHIGAKIAEVFPKLSKLSLSFPSNSDFTIHPPPSEANATQLGTLEEITIWGANESVFSSESFKGLFPNCIIKRIDPYCFSEPNNPLLRPTK